MAKTKKCNKCGITKNIVKEFYICQNAVLTHCKKCVIKRNNAYALKKQPWKDRWLDIEKYNAYQRDYYHKNPEKFAAYRAEFKKNHPTYNKDRLAKKKLEQN